MPSIEIEKFSELVGEPVNYRNVLEILKSKNMQYDVLSAEEREHYIVKTLHDIDRNEFSPQGKRKWEIGWGENFEAYKNSKITSDLFPKYRGIDLLCRMDGEFIRPHSNSFETDLYTAFHYWVAEKYFSEYSDIFEFGCGTGINLKALSDAYPNKTLHGLDWVQPSVDAIALLRENEHINVQGHLFDMFNPDYSLEVPKNSGFYTFHSAEQLGENYQPFLDFILEKNPKRIVHIEPFVEFYKDDNVFDYTAIKFHRLRGYIDGYYNALKQYEAEGKIRILKSHRNRFGSYYQESAVIVVWEPINKGK